MGRRAHQFSAMVRRCRERPGSLPVRDLVVRVQHPVGEGPLEDDEAVGPGGHQRQVIQLVRSHRGVGRLRKLLGDGQRPPAHAVQEEHGGQPGVHQLPGAQGELLVPVLVEVHPHVRGVHAAQPPLHPGDAQVLHHARTQREDGLLHYVGGLAEVVPEGRLVGGAQALGAQRPDAPLQAAEEGLRQGPSVSSGDWTKGSTVGRSFR